MVSNILFYESSDQQLEPAERRFGIQCAFNKSTSLKYSNMYRDKCNLSLLTHLEHYFKRVIDYY